MILFQIGGFEWRQESKKVIKDETITIKAIFYGNKVDRRFVLDEERTIVLSEEDTISIKASDIVEIDDIPQPENNSAHPVAVADPLSLWIQVELFEHGKYFFI
jgi:hypothetical protein